MRWLRFLVSLPCVFLMGLVRAYRLLFSAWVGQRCRFTPSCSHYALQALAQHGAVGGSALTAWRILRCHPLCDGGHDPVPDNMPWRRRNVRRAPGAAGLFTGLVQSDCEPSSAVVTPESTFPKKPS